LVARKAERKDLMTVDCLAAKLGILKAVRKVVQKEDLSVGKKEESLG
jgi:hypothetical protein